MLFFDRGTGLHTTCRHIDTVLSTRRLILHSACRVNLALTLIQILPLRGSSCGCACSHSTYAENSDPVSVVMHNNLHARLLLPPFRNI
jgi:hypothetical protein